MYLSVDAKDGFHIWRQRFPRGRPEQLTFGPTEEEGIAVAPDGHSLLTSAGIEQSSVWLHDTKGERQISSEGFATLAGLEYGSASIHSVFSPDGKKIFYLVRKESSRAFKSGELWAAELESGRTEPIFPGVSITDFDISPDGEHITYASPTSQGSSRVWVASLNRLRPPQKLTSYEADQPRFGPAGDVLFRVREDNSYSVHCIKGDGTARQKVIPDFVPSFRGVSPDGKWLLGLSPLQGDQPVALTAIPIQGGSPVRICDFCDVGWGRRAKFLYIRLREVGALSGGTTFVIELGRGKNFPPLPPSGLRSATDLKALKVVAVIDMTGKLLRVTVQRNLFRIPLN
jgi:Tol biopolymer transport system component